MRAVILLATLLAVAMPALAQTPGGNVATIPNADIQALAKTLPSLQGNDELLRVVGINNGEYNVGVALVYRPKAVNVQTGLSHHEITEIYHVISGRGTMVTGTAMENAKDSPSANMLERVGPTAAGGKITGGESRKIGPGDVIIIPPNTPHGWSEVSEELVYLVMRIDPKKVLKVK